MHYKEHIDRGETFRVRHCSRTTDQLGVARAEPGRWGGEPGAAEGEWPDSRGPGPTLLQGKEIECQSEWEVEILLERCC